MCQSSLADQIVLLCNVTCTDIVQSGSCARSKAAGELDEFELRIPPEGGADEKDQNWTVDDSDIRFELNLKLADGSLLSRDGHISRVTGLYREVVLYSQPEGKDRGMFQRNGKCERFDPAKKKF